MTLQWWWAQTFPRCKVIRRYEGLGFDQRLFQLISPAFFHTNMGAPTDMPVPCISRNNKFNACSKLPL